MQWVRELRTEVKWSHSEKQPGLNLGGLHSGPPRPLPLREVKVHPVEEVSIWGASKPSFHTGPQEKTLPLGHCGLWKQVIGRGSLRL